MSDKDTDQTPTITPAGNGPLIVSGLKEFRNSRGETIKAKAKMALCRCGASKTKPFCDGTHTKIGFTDEKSPDRVPDQLDTYEGDGITILDNRGVCSHFGACTSCLPSVWLQGTEPWIDAKGADKQEIIETIRQCPSGALSYIEDGETKNAFHETPEIQIDRNGPYLVRGGVGLEDVAFGDGASLEHYALCR